MKYTLEDLQQARAAGFEEGTNFGIDQSVKAVCCLVTLFLLGMGFLLACVLF